MRAPVAPLRRPAHLHRRHAALRREGGHRVRPARPRRSWIAASSCPTTSWAASSASASTATTPAAAATSSTASPAPSRQAELLDKITARAARSTSSSTSWCPTEVVLERLAARRVCTDCGANYSVDSPPKYGWVCDNCGGEVIQRADDTPEAIQKRLDLYERETAPLIAWYAEPRPAGRGRRARPGRRGHRCAWSRPSTRPARPEVRGPPTTWPRCAGPARVVAEMHAAIRDAIRPGVTTRELDRIGRDVIERRGARSNFLGYGHPPLPRRDLRLAQRRDRPRHPRARTCCTRATSSPSTAAPSSRAGTATPPSPPGWGTIDPEAPALIEVDRGVPGRRASPRCSPAGACPTSAPPCRRWPRRPGSRWCGSTPATASARPCTRPPTSPTGASRARAASWRRARPTPSSPWSAPAGPTTLLLDDGWTVVTADGRLAAHAEHTIAITDDGPEILTRALTGRLW